MYLTKCINTLLKFSDNEINKLIKITDTVSTNSKMSISSYNYIGTFTNENKLKIPICLTYYLYKFDDDWYGMEIKNSFSLVNYFKIDQFYTLLKIISYIKNQLENE